MLQSLIKKISTWIENDFEKWFSEFAEQLTGWGERLFWFILGFAVISLLDGVSEAHISVVLNNQKLLWIVMLLVAWLRVIQLVFIDLIDYENGGHKPDTNRNRGAK